MYGWDSTVYTLIILPHSQCILNKVSNSPYVHNPFSVAMYIYDDSSVNKSFKNISKVDAKCCEYTAINMCGDDYNTYTH